MSEVTNADVAAHWHEHHADRAEIENENTLKDAAVCFFNLCQGAMLGKLVIGRRGQATRLQITVSELETFIASGPSALPHPVEDEAGPTDLKLAGEPTLKPAPAENAAGPETALGFTGPMHILLHTART